MSEKRRALGRGLGALIPSGTATADRPVDVFFRDRDEPAENQDGSASSGGAAGDVPAGQEPAPKKPAAAAVDPHALRPVPGAEFADLPVGSIRPNPKQPRTVFDEDDMAARVALVYDTRDIEYNTHQGLLLEAGVDHIIFNVRSLGRDETTRYLDRLAKDLPLT